MEEYFEFGAHLACYWAYRIEYADCFIFWEYNSRIERFFWIIGTYGFSLDAHFIAMELLLIISGELKSVESIQSNITFRLATTNYSLPSSTQFHNQTQGYAHIIIGI